MNKKQTCVAIWRLCTMMCLLLCSFSTIKAQTFERLWEQVEQAEQKSLPQTVIKLTNDIFRKGLKEKNSPQMMKAYLYRMNHQAELTPDSLYTHLKEMERWSETADKPTDRAVLHSLIAGIYANYASENRWNLRNSQAIVDEAPADMREWTFNMFVDKVRDCVLTSLKDSVLLVRTSAKDYLPLVIQGKTSEYYGHDLYHLLAVQGVGSLAAVDDVEQDIMRIYQNLMTTCKNANRMEGYVLATLHYWEWRRKNDANFQSFVPKSGSLGLTQDPYIAELMKLKREVSDLPVCAEVYLSLAYEAYNNSNLPEALRLCEEALRLYPSYGRIEAHEYLKKCILQPSLSFRTSSVVYPNKEMKLSVSHKNLDGFTLQILRDKKQMAAYHYSLTRSANYQMADTTLAMKAPELGNYTLRIVPDISLEEERIDEAELNVTRLKALVCNIGDKQQEVVVLDAETGLPVADAKVSLCDGDKKVYQVLSTGSDGKARFAYRQGMKERYCYLQAAKGTDVFLPMQRVNFRNLSSGKGKAKEQLTLFTDRSVYRPGQTVYLKGVAYMQEMDTTDVISDKSYTVVLRDANRQELARKKVKTNEFGSFTTDFTLPSACLNGTFTLNVGRWDASIRVEEYKRPTFNIDLRQPQESYQLGDSIQVQGNVKTFSGVSMSGAQVKYTIRRSTRFFWMTGGVFEQQVAGEVMADGEGNFRIPLCLDGDAAAGNNRNLYYRYMVTATVTSVAGETQSSVIYLAAGPHPLMLRTQLKEQMCKDSIVSLTFEAQNLNGQPIAAKGSYALYLMKDEQTKEVEETPVMKGDFTANEAMALQWRDIPSGRYLLKVSARDAQGHEATAEATTVLYSLNDRRPPVNSVLWTHSVNLDFDASRPAVFCLGTTEQDTYVLMNVFCDNCLLESRAMLLSDTIVRYEYPYRESYGDGISVNLCAVKKGAVYNKYFLFEKTAPDKKLVMKWVAFRDKLQPGSSEEWRLTIKTPQGTPVDAEMLAMMYDASLDKIWKHNQDFRLSYTRYVRSNNWTVGAYNYIGLYFTRHIQAQLVPGFDYDHFFNVTLSGGQVTPISFVSAPSGIFQKNAPGMFVTGASRRVHLLEGDAAVNSESLLTSKSLSPYIMIRGISGSTMQKTRSSDGTLVADSPSSLPQESESLRTNFSETAFFYPQLRTNAQGEVSFSFTMPESLTRWKFCGFAHTKDMMNGALDAEVVTSKEFMLTPNLPRFVRVGDRVSIAASITNQTGSRQAGIVRLILFDPLTEKVISEQKQKFSVDAGQTVAASFMFEADDSRELLGCRMMADSDTFSDGEQQLIPVLSNKEHLIETLAMPIRGKETRIFSLDNLFNHHSPTATNRRLTVEFTGNPAWYAVQALPALANPVNENAISWATVFYANSLASYILNSQPRIKAVFDSWKQQGGTKETFLSNLEKNQDLKNILLSESSWVLEAQTESQQKERIATLFDLNNLNANNAVVLNRLQELQNASGAWSWCKGMGDSRYITTYIVNLNVRLAMLTGKELTGTALEMQNKALLYLHREALKEYEDILKKRRSNELGNYLSFSALQYLYIVAVSGESIPAANQEAYDYFLSRVSGLLTSASMNAKAMAAVILARSGRSQEAQDFIASLKEHLTKTDERGMSFAFNEENPYLWEAMRLQTHVRAMEAFKLTDTDDADTLEEMKLWLLKQKQTQQWDSPVATADAVFALLMNGSNLLANQGDVRISVGGESLDTSADADKTAIPALGYVKRSFSQKKVVEAKKIKVEKRDEGVAWGAVYAEYDSPINDVRQMGTGLNVQKKLYVERTEGTASRLYPVTEETSLKVGDKIIFRLTIRTDRPMDFVQLKDQRAGCLEPEGNVSGYRWSAGTGYYIDIKDASTNFFFDRLAKGVYMLEYSCRVSRKGDYESGLSVMQCSYAPEYASHSESVLLHIK